MANPMSTTAPMKSICLVRAKPKTIQATGNRPAMISACASVHVVAYQVVDEERHTAAPKMMLGNSSRMEGTPGS